jgi:hypothetical protein
MTTSHLIPCSACHRHVRSHETACPFCEAAIVPPETATREPSTRLGRAAMFAFRATTVAALSALPACSGGGGQVYGGPPITEAPPTTGTGPIVPSTVPPSTTIMQPYGAPPIPPPPPPTTEAPPEVPPEVESQAEPPHHHHEASVHALYGAAAPAYGATPGDYPEGMTGLR